MSTRAPAPGQVALTAQVTGQTQNGSAYDSTGVMIKASTTANSAFYYVYAVPTNGTTLQGGIYVDYQSANGGTPVNLAFIPETTSTYPGNSGNANTCLTGTTATCYLGIERSDPPWRNPQIEAYFSSDGSHWQAIDGSNVTTHGDSPLYNAGYIGVASTSDSYGNASTANLASVSLTTSTIYDEFPAECPPDLPVRARRLHCRQPVGESQQLLVIVTLDRIGRGNGPRQRRDLRLVPVGLPTDERRRQCRRSGWGGVRVPDARFELRSRPVRRHGPGLDREQRAVLLRLCVPMFRNRARLSHQLRRQRHRDLEHDTTRLHRPRQRVERAGDQFLRVRHGAAVRRPATRRTTTVGPAGPATDHRRPSPPFPASRPPASLPRRPIPAGRRGRTSPMSWSPATPQPRPNSSDPAAAPAPSPAAPITPGTTPRAIATYRSPVAGACPWASPVPTTHSPPQRQRPDSPPTAIWVRAGRSTTTSSRPPTPPATSPSSRVMGARPPTAHQRLVPTSRSQAPLNQVPPSP